MNSTRITQGLSLGLALTLAALLAACAGKEEATPLPPTATSGVPTSSTATATSAPQPTAAPTATLAPTATPRPTTPPATATQPPVPTATRLPPSPTATATATPAPPTPTPSGPSLLSTLNQLSGVGLDLQGPPALSPLEGLDTGDVSLPTSLVAVPGLNLDIGIDAIYSVKAPQVTGVPAVP